MKKKILVISGGISKERKISLETGKQVAKELRKNGYLIKVCEPDHKLIFQVKDFKPQAIFNALHGQFGEDGYIQSILESLKIPYTHSGVISSAKAMDKEISKKIFLKNKILTPKYFLYSFNGLEKNIKNFKPSVIFNALHGQFGEDGYIQTILDRYKISYTHSDAIASSIAMDKEISKKIFIKNKIKTPKFFIYSYDIPKPDLIKKIKRKLKFPVVVKPINEGSSVNVYISDKSNLSKILDKLKSYKKVMIEQFIAGREIQVAIMGDRKLGAIELKPKRKFYDYQAKYDSKAKTKHIIPVELPKLKFNQLMNTAFKAHKIIGCNGVTRSDFKYFKGDFYLLEINTQPGMTKLSLVPEIALYKGITFIKLIEWMLKDASKKK